jgi:hypothetical protein
MARRDRTVPIPIELKGYALSAVGHMPLYCFTVSCAHDIDEPERRDFEDVLSAWYLLGFHGAFGRVGFNRLSDITYERTAPGDVVKFEVQGVLELPAIDALLQALIDRDLDVVVEAVRIVVTDEEAPARLS